MDILESDALAQAKALKAGKLSAAELMQATLDRIAKVNPDINAIVSLRDGDALMAQARQADEAPRKGWLHGIPIAIKDLTDAAGLPTSKGSPIYDGQVAAQDDVMVARLRAAGALVIGKTNTPEFGLGSHTFNPVHGVTRNPYGLGKSAGGSSGGAAAALAARMVSVADGSDMMGSLRNPAGWNNVYGMRPTWGTVAANPEAEMFGSMLATAGPMARSPRDMAALLGTMTGQDHLTSIAQPWLTPEGGGRIAWLGNWDGALPYEYGITAVSEAALAQFDAMGAKVEALHAPFELATIWNSWINLRSFCVAAGRKVDYDNADTRKALKPAVLWEVERGLAMTPETLLSASTDRSAWYARALELFQTFDVLALPSAQVFPFDADLTHPTTIAGQEMDTYHRWMEVVVPASLLGLPVVNVPIGFGENGLPAGLQLIGPLNSDSRLLALAEAWHQATRWPQTRPPLI